MHTPEPTFEDAAKTIKKKLRDTFGFTPEQAAQAIESFRRDIEHDLTFGVTPSECASYIYGEIINPHRTC